MASFNFRLAVETAVLAFVAMLCFVLATGTVHAQQAVTVAELKPSPEAALRAFEQPLNAPYELGRGDEISVDFNGRPEMNARHIVGPDGKITLPLAGSVAVAGETREQAAESVAAALKPYYADLSVTVGVDKYTSNQVLLMGAVEHPGIQTFDRAPTLLEVVTRGGTRSNVSSEPAGSFNLAANAHLSSPAIPERVAIYRGSDRVVWVDLKTLLDSGSPLADMRLQRDDIVYVPSSSERYVSVLGQVAHPGALMLEGNSTLAKLIALSGGLTDAAGKSPAIQIIQPSTGKTRTVSFKQLLQPGPTDITLKSGDIIFVPKSGFNSAAYVLEKLSPLVTMFTASALILH